MANGMSSLMVGASGLKTAQAALNTTAHNLSNINTIGYTRQQIGFKDNLYVKYNSLSSPVNSTYGLGVGVQAIRRIRDEFIDKAYRNENGRLGYYNSQYKAVEEIEDLFGEMQGVTYQECMIGLSDAINELSKEPGSTVKRSALIQSASAFMTRSDAVYKGLKDYQQTLNEQVLNIINSVNDLSERIHELNKQISKIESTGQESANDLRDQRDAALDELSQYVRISYYEAENGAVMVNAESMPLVTDTAVTKMSYKTLDGTNLYVPTFPAFERDVYPEEELYSSTTNDQGQLKGLLLARGSVNVDYSDIPVKPDKNDDKYLDANGNFDQTAYDKDYALYEQKQAYYNKYIEPSAILSAIAGIDKLVNGICTTLNQVLCPTKELTTDKPLLDANGKEYIPDYYEYNSTQKSELYDGKGNLIKGVLNADGKTYTYKSLEKLYEDDKATQVVTPDKYYYSVLDEDKTDYGNDDDHTVGEGIFKRETTEDFVDYTDANGNTYKLYNNRNQNGQRSDYTLGNIMVNPTVSQDVSKIPMTNAQGKEDISRGQALMDAWNADFASLNPESYAIGNFESFYNNFTSDFATIGDVLSDFVDHQQTMVTGYDNQRQQSEGVSSDEELQKMIKYQQSYNAASRYINVISEMLEHIVTSLGRA